MSVSNLLLHLHLDRRKENAKRARKSKRGARKKRYRAREYSWEFNDCRYQVQKLRARVTEKIGRHGYAADKKVSSHMFKNDGRWFKISVKVEELAIDNARAIQEM